MGFVSSCMLNSFVTYYPRNGAYYDMLGFRKYGTGSLPEFSLHGLAVMGTFAGFVLLGLLLAYLSRLSEPPR